MEHLRARKGKRIDLNTQFDDEYIDAISIYPSNASEDNTGTKCDMGIDARGVYECDVETMTDREQYEQEVQTDKFYQAQD